MKSFIYTTILCAISLNSAAQTLDEREEIRFGAKAGINISNVYDSQNQDFVASNKIGFAAGVFLGIPLGKYLGVQPELLFSQKGFTGNGKYIGIDYKFVRTSTYIDIPILLQIKPSKYITILAGPEYSYLTSILDEFKTEFGSAQDREDFTNDNLRKNMLGIVLGADFNFRYLVLSGRVGWDALFNRGDGTSEAPRYKNQWAQITAGFAF